MIAYIAKRTWRHWDYDVTFELRSSSGMGRFGGGWNWKLGIQWGSTSVILSLLICSIIFRRRNEQEGN